MTKIRKEHVTTLRMEPELIDGLRYVKDRDGIPVSEQVRRAILAWLETRNAVPRRKKGAA